MDSQVKSSQIVSVCLNQRCGTSQRWRELVSVKIVEQGEHTFLNSPPYTDSQNVQDTNLTRENCALISSRGICGINACKAGRTRWVTCR
jgi:hypothetical protein